MNIAKIFPGDTLIPHEDFRMEDGEIAFTKGVHYSVMSTPPDKVVLIDDQDDIHHMSSADIEGWEKYIEPTD